MSSRPEPQQISDDDRQVAATIEDPVLFAAGWLSSSVWRVQAEIMHSVAARQKTAVKACHSSGKTFVAGLIALWWMARYPDGIVITTAPTWVQVQKLLWGEIHRAIERAQVAFPKPNKTELYHKADNYLLGLSTNEGVRFQGFHGRVLIVIDEAPGVQPDIYEAIEGIRAGGDVRVLMLGNPIIPSGPFYNAFTAQRASWNTISISAFDTPNLAGLGKEDLLRLTDDQLGENAAPHLTTRRWVREKLQEWGEDHPLYQSKVLGQFPKQASNALISLTWVEQAAGRGAVDTGGPLDVGVDVAGPGEDETAVAIVDGPSILRLHVFTTADARGDVVAALAEYGRASAGGRIRSVNVDSVGIGFHLATHLRDLGYAVRFVNVGRVGRSREQKEKYRNLKAEFYWGLRMRFQEGDIAGLTDEVAQAQLTGILYEHDARGRIVIESKEDARARGVKSPDRAESIMLAFAKPMLGWHLLSDEDEWKEEQKGSSFDEQLRRVVPEAYEQRTRTADTCADCANAGERNSEPWCNDRRFLIKLKDPACRVWEPAPREAP